MRIAGGCFFSCNSSKDGQICACVGDLSKGLNIGMSTVSHHIKELRRAGLIRVERRGQKVECSVERSAVVELADYFSTLQQGAESGQSTPVPGMSHEDFENGRGQIE